MRRVLIVSPHFPPVNAADHQRVRMSLLYLAEFGWNATVLGVKPNATEGMPVDSLLEETIPSEINVCRTGAVAHGFTRRIGLGNLALRSLPYLWRAGNRLLSQEQFDLVFFSTTQFPVMILGPKWKRRFGVPYVVDFQDPWLDDYYERTGTSPPGGKVRHRLSGFLAKQLEPRVMRDTSQVLAVSPAYIETFRTRYPHLREDQFTALPFGAPERDFEFLATASVQQRVFDKTDGKRHLVYVGRAGPDMRSALGLLFSALAQSIRCRSDAWHNVRLHFIGTSYAPLGRAEKTVEPIAHEFGVGHLVEERTDRIGYFEALQALVEADGLLVIGSDSASYTPSKIYPYVLARRPLLAILHEKSPAAEILLRCRAGHLVPFPEDGSGAALQRAVDALKATWWDIESETAPDVDWQEFSQYTAREMTRKQCQVFDRAVAGTNRQRRRNT